MRPTTHTSGVEPHVFLHDLPVVTGPAEVEAPESFWDETWADWLELPRPQKPREQARPAQPPQTVEQTPGIGHLLADREQADAGLESAWAAIGELWVGSSDAPMFPPDVSEWFGVSFTAAP